MQAVREHNRAVQANEQAQDVDHFSCINVSCMCSIGIALLIIGILGIASLFVFPAMPLALTFVVAVFSSSAVLAGILLPIVSSCCLPRIQAENEQHNREVERMHDEFRQVAINNRQHHQDFVDQVNQRHAAFRDTAERQFNAFAQQ